MNKQLIDFFKQEELYNEEFFEFISDKVFVFPNDEEDFWWGCFPIVQDDILIDIRLLVPEIETEKDLLINIHEFTHAIELYGELGMIYEDKREEREFNAKKMEEKYVKTKKCQI